MPPTTNPVYNFANSFRIWCNVETCTFYNINGQVYSFDYCIRRPVGNDAENDIGSNTMGQRTRCHFMVAISEWDTSIEFPQINCRVVDSSGVEWYVSEVENIYFGNLLRIYCDAKAGIGTTDRQYPLSTLRITGDGNLPTAEPNIFYSYTFTASGGEGSYTWSIASGSLP